MRGELGPAAFGAEGFELGAGVRSCFAGDELAFERVEVGFENGAAFGVIAAGGQDRFAVEFLWRCIAFLLSAGQLPGAFGAMQSSFILWRKIAGEEQYQKAMTDYFTQNGGL